MTNVYETFEHVEGLERTDLHIYKDGKGDMLGKKPSKLAVGDIVQVKGRKWRILSIDRFLWTFVAERV